MDEPSFADWATAARCSRYLNEQGAGLPQSWEDTELLFLRRMEKANGIVEGTDPMRAAIELMLRAIAHCERHGLDVHQALDESLDIHDERDR